MKKLSITILALITIFSATAQHLSSFDSLSLPPNSYLDGANLTGGFQINEAYFDNTYINSTTWYGFAYSNIYINTDTITTGSNDYLYEYSTADTVGAYGSDNFGLCHTSAKSTIRLLGFAPGHEVYGMYVTNTAYDYLSMKYGDAIGKQFGGPTGMDSDWFRLTVTGWYQGIPIGDSVQFYLADFRSSDTTQHYILNTWQFLNLQPLGNVDSLNFILNSSDTSNGLMNTPAYFALNDFVTTDGASYVAPIAVNDSLTFVYMDTLTGEPDTLVANIVSNDTVPGFLANTITLLSGPEIIGATAYLNAMDSLVYIPAEGITGTDTLYYSICNTIGFCDTAEILIYVLSPVQSDTAGITEIGMQNLRIYPNPASSVVSVSYTTPIQSISFIDMTGREVMQVDLHSAESTIDISSLSSGIYTVSIHTANDSAVRRLIKE